MAQTGYTPISSYYSATTGNTPTAGNLVAGELAINTADGKLFYKDSSGVVQTLATKDATKGSFTTLTSTGASSFATSSGSVGIGTSSPASKLNVYSTTGTTADFAGSICVTNASYTAGTYAGVLFETADTLNSYITAVRQGSYGGILTFGTNDASTGTALVERMRIDSSGNLCIGTSTAPGYSNISVKNSGSATIWNTGVNSSGNYVVFRSDSVGVYIVSGATSWTANSDERLKTKLKPFENAVEKIVSLRSGTGRYLNDDESVSRAFLIAQDVQKVLPEAVDVQDDEQKTLGLRYQDVIPLLTAAIQEQQVMIEELKAKVAALEAA